jgi:hypothetical protein
MEFLFAIYYPKKSNNTPYCQGHAVSILSVYNIKCCGIALNLTGQEWEVHLRGGHEMGRKSIWNLTNKRLKLFQLIVCKCRLFKSYRIIRLWAKAVKRFGAILAFINTVK